MSYAALTMLTERKNRAVFLKRRKIDVVSRYNRILRKMA